MAIVINGSGTVTGLAVGGLPDGTVDEGTLASSAVTEAKLATDSVTAAKIPNTVEAGFKSGRKNIIINGAMNVAQRATSSAGLGDGGGYFTLDRYRFSSSTSGRLTQSQSSVTDLPAFANAMKLDCTTADTSIGASEECSLEYRLEGQDLQQLKKGTSSAEKVTVSFYMKTNKAFTFMCELDDTDNNRVNTQQFTTSTSWTRHTLTFVGDTTGTLDNDSARSMRLNIWIHAGSNFTGGTYSANTWQSRQSSDNMRAVGISSFYDDTANEIQLTGLQMEVGDTATDFEHRSFGEELALCKRYFESSYPHGTVVGVTSFITGYLTRAVSGNTNSEIGGPSYTVEKRAIPTVVIYHAVNGATNRVYKVSDGSSQTITGLAQHNVHGGGYLQLSSGADNSYKYHFSADAEL